ncbi:hypothetical protein GCM10007067_12520 [Lysobacter bugurensis]|uniref:Uncharacterized protein n=1 Tax=Cognatilysobacter bugurensis TaxID=543356 RepID=A0A918SXI8_9GAMM|nr:hypothetical protein GCM10007067_12520 [Lysobacter bugurensis]
MRQVAWMLGVVVLASCAPVTEENVARAEVDLLSTVFNGCPKPEGRPLRVTVPELIARRVDLHGALVSLTGHYHSGFEHGAIYADPRPEPDEHTFNEGIWILRAPPELPGEEVEVTGYFTAKN